MKSLKEMLATKSDRAIEAMAMELWESYEADGEYGIEAQLGVDLEEASKMLDVPFDTLEAPAYLADALRIYRDGGSEEAYLRAELRQIRAREAEIKARLKALEAEKPEEEEPIEVFRVLNAEGAEGLRRKLQELETKSLKKVIRENHLDTFRQTAKVTNAEKLVSFILERAMAINTQGDVFRNYAY